MTTSSKTVLLAGASGVFGQHIARVLTDAGYDVAGIGRGAGNAVRADLNNRDQLLGAVRGRHADIVIHAATALKRPPARHRDMAATDELRTTGMRNLIEAAREVGATRLITENMIFGYGYEPHGTTVLTEAAPFGPKQANAALDAHVGAMRTKEELTFATPGIDGVSLRFGLFYGPGATESILPALRKRMVPAPKSAGRVLPWVRVDDAALAVLAAIEQGRPGEAYNIVDDEPMGFGEGLVATAAAFGAPKPLAMPAGMLSPLRLLSVMLKSNLRLSNAKARDELGWAPRYPSVPAGLAAMTGPGARPHVAP
jgi:nucleoside-diphosphate-sugar epimerase